MATIHQQMGIIFGEIYCKYTYVVFKKFLFLAIFLRIFLIPRIFFTVRMRVRVSK